MPFPRFRSWARSDFIGLKPWFAQAAEDKAEGGEFGHIAPDARARIDSRTTGIGQDWSKPELCVLVPALSDEELLAVSGTDTRFDRQCSSGTHMLV